MDLDIETKIWTHTYTQTPAQIGPQSTARKSNDECMHGQVGESGALLSARGGARVQDQETQGRTGRRQPERSSQLLFSTLIDAPMFT